MKPSERLTAILYISGVAVYDPCDGRIMRRMSDGMTGAELADSISKAIAWRNSLNACIEAMSAVLDSGETVEDHKARIEYENQNPCEAVENHGWMAIEDFAELCDKSDTGFYSRIKNLKGRIVRPKARDQKRLLGNEWTKYPERFEHWGDYFDFADNWTDALAQVRKEQANAMERRP